MSRRRETPQRFKNPSGKIVWKSRWTDKAGKRRFGWKEHGLAGTCPTKREAQEIIDQCYALDEAAPVRQDTVGTYFATWVENHPRSRNTNRTNEGRVRRVLDVELDGTPLRDWPFGMLRRKHANLLVGHLLVVQGRARTGAVNILRTLSAMTEDAIDDEAAVGNPFKGVKVKANDPRIQKARTPVRVFSWQQMHAFARSCADARSVGDQLNAWRAVYADAMIRVLSDCGLRAGELLPLCRSDLSFSEATLQVRWSTFQGEILQGTKTDHGQEDAGRVVPVPPELLRMLDSIPARIDGKVLRGESEERLLFPAPQGGMWTYSHWHRDVWTPGVKTSGLSARPHEFRHSQISLLRAAGIDAADLAATSGHNVDTASKTYVHALGRSHEAIRMAVGQ